MAMGKPFRLFCVVNVLGDSLEGDDSMQKLARWQHEWRITAEAEAKQAIATGLANSMTEAWPTNQMGQYENENQFQTFLVSTGCMAELVTGSNRK